MRLVRTVFLVVAHLLFATHYVWAQVTLPVQSGPAGFPPLIHGEVVRDTTVGPTGILNVEYTLVGAETAKSYVIGIDLIGEPEPGISYFGGPRSTRYGGFADVFPLGTFQTDASGNGTAKLALDLSQVPSGLYHLFYWWSRNSSYPDNYPVFYVTDYINLDPLKIDSCSKPTGLGRMNPLGDVNSSSVDGWVFEVEILPSACNFNNNRVVEVVTIDRNNTDCVLQPQDYRRLIRGSVTNGAYNNEYADVIGIRPSVLSRSCHVTSTQSIFWIDPGDPNHFVDLTSNGLNTLTMEVNISGASSTIRSCINGVCGVPPATYHPKP